MDGIVGFDVVVARKTVLLFQSILCALLDT
jgi:hypothetical protein